MFDIRTTRHGAAPAAGFTLLELMVTVAIVSILAAIAIPSYTEHVRRGKVTEIASVLGNGQVALEQFYADNKTYVGGPCPASTKSFKVTCATAATTYTLTGTGSVGDVSGFAYTVNQADARTTAGAWGSGNCWIVRKGDKC
jgi:type IV pilus assembly protein PilE